MQRSAPPRSRAAVAAALVGLTALTAFFALWGIQRTLPDLPEMDEPLMVLPALQIASTGDLNPHRFDYPGSTIIYPLAAGIHVWQAAAHGGPWLSPGPSLPALFAQSLTPFFLGARLISLAYGLLCIPLLYAVGARCFGRTTGLVAAALLALCPTFIDFATQARTDSGASFFYLLLFGALLRLAERPSVGRQTLVGATLGLGVATRYFVAAGGAALLALEVALLARRRTGIAAIAAAGLAAIAAFLLATPYFALDFPGFRESFLVQAAKQSTHLGVDGLGALGNLRYYLREALPFAIGWPQVALAAAGAALVAWRRDARGALLLVHVAAFLAALCSLGLHWLRWLLPILPLVALLSAHALVTGLEAIAVRTGLGARAASAAAAAAVALLWIAPARELIAMSRLHSNPTTAIVARDWIEANVPPGTRFAQEWYTAPIDPVRYPTAAKFTLADVPLDTYRLQGVRMVMVSGAIYGRYFAEPARYPNEIAFYKDLFARGTLVQQFLPSDTRGGSPISVYRLD